MKSNETHYSNLNILETSNDNEIENAYEYLSIKNKNDYVLIKKIKDSYDVLIDPVLRTEYDNKLKEKIKKEEIKPTNKKINYKFIIFTFIFCIVLFILSTLFINFKEEILSYVDKSQTFKTDIQTITFKEKKSVELTEKNEEIKKNFFSENHAFTPLAISALTTLYNKSDSSGIVKIANNKLATVWFEQDFDLNNNQYHTVFIYENELDENGEVIWMNGVSVQIDIVTYKKEDVEWGVVTAQKNVVNKDDGVGNYGKPIGLGAEAIKTSNNVILYLIEESRIFETDKKMYPYYGTLKQLFIYMNNKWTYAGTINNSATNEEQLTLSTFKNKWKYNGNVTLNETSFNSIPDIIVKKIGTQLDNSEENIVAAKDDIYHFDGTRYVKIKQPEKPEENTIIKDDYCYNLWYERNLIFAKHGHCFNTPLGKKLFGLFCKNQESKLTILEQKRALSLKKEEEKSSCNINVN